MELMPIIRPTLPDFREFEELVRPSWDEGQVTTGRIVALRGGGLPADRRTEAEAMSSCTAGLMLAAQAMELPAGAEVIVPSFTFAPPRRRWVWNGLVRCFCDCLPETLTLDPADVERNLTSRTAAICAHMSTVSPRTSRHWPKSARDTGSRCISTAPGPWAPSTRAGRRASSDLRDLLAEPDQGRHRDRGRRDLHQRPGSRRRLRSMRDYGKDPQKGRTWCTWASPPG